MLLWYRNIKAVVMRVAACLFTSLLAGSGRQAAAAPHLVPGLSAVTVTLDQRPVTLTPEIDGDGEISIAVRLGKQSLRFSPGDAVRYQKSPSQDDITGKITTEDGYLFFRIECLCLAHRFPVMEVFAIRRGKLIHFGSVQAYESPHRPGRLPEAPSGGVFYDSNSALEENGITMHASAPSIAIALREVNARLVYDPALCWPSNAAYYVRARGYVSGPAQLIAADDTSTDSDAVEAGLLAKAGIDKSCHRDAALKTDFAAARARLAPPVFKIFAKDIARMKIADWNGAPGRDGD